MSLHDLASVSSPFVNIDLDPSSPKRNSELNLSYESNKNSSASLSTISLNGSIESLRSSDEPNKENSDESDHNQTPKIATDPDSTTNTDNKFDINNTEDSEDKHKELTPEITVVAPDQVTKTSSKETLRKSTNIEVNVVDNSNNIDSDSLRDSKEYQAETLKISAEINLSPHKSEELTPKKT